MKIYILQGSVATHLRCGKIFNNPVVANFIQYVPVKEFWKLVKIFEDDIDSDKVVRFLRHCVNLQFVFVTWYARYTRLS